MISRIRTSRSSGSIANEIIQCGGCKQFSFRKTQSNSEEYDPVTGEHPGLYPSRVQGRTPVNDHELLPTALQRIYLETLSAINSEQPVLAGIGIRAIVETVCRQQNADGKDLEKKIDDLVTKQVLPRAGADILQKLRISGTRRRTKSSRTRFYNSGSLSTSSTT